MVVMLLGPPSHDINGNLIIGGQVSHISYLKKLYESDPAFELMAIASSSGLHKSSGLFEKVTVFFSSLLKFILLGKRADVVHINSTLDARSVVRDVVYIIILKLIGVRYIIQFHGGSVRVVLGIKIIRQVFKYNCKSAACNLFFTKENAEVYNANLGMDNYELVRNYLPIDVCINGLYGLIRSRDCSNRFLFAGRVDAKKGVFELIYAFKKLLGIGIFYLDIAGTGPDFNRAVELVDSLSMRDHVTFHGHVSGDKKLSLFQSADFFVLPSFEEAYPYGLIEASFSGLFLITTLVGSVPRIVEDGAFIEITAINPDAIFDSMVQAIGMNKGHIFEDATIRIINKHSKIKMREYYSSLWSRFK